MAPGNGHLLRKEPLLHLTGNLHLAIDALALGCLGGQRMGQFSHFDGQPGLGGDGMQEMQIGRSVCGLGAFGPESHHAHESVAPRQRQQQLGVDQVEDVPLRGSCHQVPGVGVLAVKARRLVGGREVACGRGLRGQGNSTVNGYADGLLQLKVFAATEEHCHLIDVQRLGYAAGDGFKEWGGFGEAPYLVGKLVEHDLSVVRLAEELAIEPELQLLLHAEAEYEHQGKNRQRAEHV